MQPAFSSVCGEWNSTRVCACPCGQDRLCIIRSEERADTVLTHVTFSREQGATWNAEVATPHTKPVLSVLICSLPHWPFQELDWLRVALPLLHPQAECGQGVPFCRMKGLTRST